METVMYEHAVSTVDEATFLKRTYLHLFAAVGVFILLEIFLFQSGIAHALAPVMVSNWLIVIGGFMVLGFVSSYFTRRQSTPGMQYVEMGITILLQAIIFIPLLAYAVIVAGPSVLSAAISTTLAVFTALTAFVVYSGKNFSFLGPFLGVIGIAALVAIVGAVIFGVGLGFYFALAMAVFAAAVVLYETSNVLHTYREGQHVAAATALFASVALLFYYILSAFVSRN